LPFFISANTFPLIQTIISQLSETAPVRQFVTPETLPVVRNQLTLMGQKHEISNRYYGLRASAAQAVPPAI